MKFNSIKIKFDGELVSLVEPELVKDISANNEKIVFYGFDNYPVATAIREKMWYTDWDGLIRHCKILWKDFPNRV